MLVKYADFLEK